MVHPGALVDPAALLHPTVTVEPLAVIGPRVRIGPRTRVGAHAVLTGDLELGADNQVGPHAVLGGAPQIRDLEGEPGAIRIGDGNVIRELVTIHAGRPGSATRLGHRNLLMVGSHVAHDCRIGDGVELANGVQLAGHVEVGDHAGLGGLAAVHQFVRVGAHAFVAAGAMVSQDVPPFSLVAGDRARCYGLNRVGLERSGFAPEVRRELGRALRLLLRAPSLEEGLARVRAEPVPPSEPVLELLRFAQSSKRGLCAWIRAAGGGE